jgi:hypothetical protein
MDHRSLLLVAGLLCLPSTAFAYIDPGSGMLLWQGLIAAIGAGLVFVRRPWQVIKKFLTRWRK